MFKSARSDRNPHTRSYGVRRHAIQEEHPLASQGVRSADWPVSRYKVLLLSNSMKLIKEGLESVVKTSKAVGNSIKRNARAYLAAGLIGLGAAGIANADEGTVSLRYNIGTFYTNRSCSIGNLNGASAGIDSYDFRYQELFNPSGVASKIITEVEDQELDINMRDENNTSSAIVEYSIITDGRPIPEINDREISWSVSGFDDYDVTVNGVTGRSGTFNPTSNSGSFSVSFSETEEPPQTYAPSVELNGVTNVTNSSATLEGRITDTGGLTTDAGFVYYPSDNAGSQTEVWSGTFNTPSSFSYDINNLEEDT